MSELDMRKLIVDKFGRTLSEFGFSARDASEEDQAFMTWANGTQLFLFTWPEGLTSLTVEYQKADATNLEELEEALEEMSEEFVEGDEPAQPAPEPTPEERIEFVRSTLESMLNMVGSKKAV